MRLCVVETREDCDDESRGLPSSGLRLSNHVGGWVSKEQRKCLLLNLGWLSEVHGVDALQDLWIAVARLAENS